MKKLLLATALLASFAMPASAAVIGSFGVNPTSAAGAFSNDPNGPGVGGLFTDFYTFDLIGAGFVTVASATNTFAVGGVTGPFGIQNFAAAIFETVGVPGGGDDILKFGPQFATLCASGLCQQLDGVGFLQAGSYYLQIAGDAGNLAGYGGNLSVAETPLPGAVWLFLSGLAALGFIGGGSKRKRGLWDNLPRVDFLPKAA
jgi:hypothetical protein